MKNKQKEPWLLVLYPCICIVNLGYFLLSFAKTVEFALFANKLAYLGHVFIILCMFMLISKLCGFKYKKWVSYALIALAILMYSMVLTTGHLDWYYKSVSLIYVDGAAKLVKEYGFLHPVYTVHIIAYFVAMLVTIFYSLKIKKSASQKLAGMMLVVVFGNIGMWLVEKLVTWNFEFLSISYLMSELVFFFVYWMLQDYVHKEEIPSAGESGSLQLTAMTADEKLNRILSFVGDDEPLSIREREVLELIMQNKKRKEIASQLHLSENTVKTYTRSLYSKLGVASREELYSLLLQNKG